MKNTLSLEELFNNRVFRVPDYQRGYAWEKQQVGEFLDDLALLDSSRRHYTGTIVLYQPPGAEEIEDSEGTSYVKVDVVDGQQRLTTTVLLLNEIAKALSKYTSSGDRAQGIEKRYVEVTDTDGLPLHKLTLNGDLDDFFKTNVLPQAPGTLAGPSVASARRLLDAKKQIAEYLDDAEGDQVNREKWLRALHSKAATRLHFNLYEVEAEAEVGLIFEVMNDRGKQLTDLEKVKNYLLYAASALSVSQDNRKKLARSVNDAWADILKKLMVAELGSPANENQLLRAHWLMAYNPQPQKWEGSKSIKARFDLRKGQHDRLLRELHEYVHGLRDCCISFCDALRPSRDGAFDSFSSKAARNDVVLWNVKFARIGTTAAFLPLLMAVRKRWPSDPEKYLEVLTLCEAVSFRIYRVARYYASYRQPAMFRLAFEVTHGMNFGDVIREVKQNYSSADSQQSFREFTDAESPQSWYGRTGIRYLLYEYESHLAAGKGGSPKIPWDETEGADSIEHILPQYIGDQPYWQERFDADDHEEYKHDIGNLTLTKGNSSLGNKPYPCKRGAKEVTSYCYENSLFVEEREIAAKWNDWTMKAINERRAMLLDWAKERWYVDFSDVSGDKYDPDDESEDEVSAGAEL